MTIPETKTIDYAADVERSGIYRVTLDYADGTREVWRHCMADYYMLSRNLDKCVITRFAVELDD